MILESVKLFFIFFVVSSFISCKNGVSSDRTGNNKTVNKISNNSFRYHIKNIANNEKVITTQEFINSIDFLNKDFKHTKQIYKKLSNFQHEILKDDRINSLYLHTSQPDSITFKIYGVPRNDQKNRAIDEILVNHMMHLDDNYFLKIFKANKNEASFRRFVRHYSLPVESKIKFLEQEIFSSDSSKIHLKFDFANWVVKKNKDKNLAVDNYVRYMYENHKNYISGFLSKFSKFNQQILLSKIDDELKTNVVNQLKLEIATFQRKPEILERIEIILWLNSKEKDSEQIEKQFDELNRNYKSSLDTFVNNLISR